MHRLALKCIQGLSRDRLKNVVVARKMREQTTAYLLAGFGFVAGLAWNEAIKAAIEALFPLDKNGILAKFIYAVVVTVLVVVVSVLLMRLFQKEETEKTP